LFLGFQPVIDIAAAALMISRQEPLQLIQRQLSLTTAYQPKLLPHAHPQRQKQPTESRFSYVQLCSFLSRRHFISQRPLFDTPSASQLSSFSLLVFSSSAFTPTYQ